MTDQKSDKQKPREFWIESMIRCWSEDGLAILKHSEDVERIKSESIHVVEMYALEAARAEFEQAGLMVGDLLHANRNLCKELQAERSRSEKLVEALDELKGQKYIDKCSVCDGGESRYEELCEAIAAYRKETADCICGSINARNCPVHQGDEK